MVKRRRARTLSFGALALLAALVPATIAFGTHSDFSGVVPGGVVVLQMGNGPTADQVVYGSETQNITTSRSSCTAVDDSFEDAWLLNIADGPAGSSLGEAKDQIGVQSGSDGNGENCVRTAPGETMTITLGDKFASGTVMGGFDLDVQLKFNSEIQATTVRGGLPQDTLTFTGEGLSDNGPDSEDNRRWAHIAARGKEFDTIVLTAVEGTFSIGGGKNLAEPGVFVTSSKGSQFAIGPVFDGEINCEPGTNSVRIDDPAVEDVVGVVTMHSLNLGSVWDADCSVKKPYDELVTESSLLFAPVLEESLARYTMILTLEDQPITTDADGQTTSLIMEYNDGFGGGDKTLQPCLGQPQFTDAFFEMDSTGLLPTEEFACYYGVSLTPTGDGFGTEVWNIFFEDDPGFSFR
jgi:hypothetical protein